jgi:hypothetical protein
MRRAAKIDGNQSDIVADLRAVGASVESLATLGKGRPDLLVGYRGANWLLEVKADKGKLTPDQEEWHPTWRGQVAIVRSADEALKVIGAIQ